MRPRLARRSGCGRRPAPSPGSACSAAIVATRRWKRVSPASSGWNAVAITFPSRTATIRPSSRRARTSTPGPTSSMIGARMKTAWTGRSPRIGTSRSVSNESSWRPKAFRSTTTSRSGRTGSSPPAIDLREDDHPGARAEDRRARAGQVQDRLGEPPAADEAAHRRALAAGQDQPVDVDEILRQAHLHALDADRGERGHVLAEGALQRQHADPHRAAPARPARRVVATSPAPRGARPRGSPPWRCRASGRPGPC